MPRLGKPVGNYGSADRGLIQGPSYNPDAAAFVLAALYCRDALNGRLDNGHAAMWHRPPWVRRLFILHTSTPWSLFVFSCCTMHVLLFFGEPSVTLSATLHASTTDLDRWGWATSLSGASGDSAHAVVLSLELFCTAALITDAGIKMAFIGFHKWRSRPTHRIYAFFIAALVLDTVLFLAGAGRPLRCLRCGVMLVRSRTLRKNVAAILAIWKVLALCTLVLFLLLLVCASTAVHLFSSSYLPSALPPPPPPLPAMPGSEFSPGAGIDEASLHSSSFYALPWGISAAFQLLTTENYPDVAYLPAAVAPVSMAFFIVWWYLISFIVLAIVTAVIVDSYWTVSKRQIVSEGRVEKLGLMRAFELLHKRRGHFGMRVWERFLKELMPGASVTEARVRFAMLDLNQNGHVDALEFLQIRSQLEMQLHELPQGGPEGQLIASRGSWLNPAAVGAPPRRLCRYVLSLAAAVDVRWYTLVDMGAATGQVVLLLLVHPETGPSRAKALSDASLALAVCTTAIFAIRAALHAHVSTWGTFLLDWSHTADATVVALAIACYVAIYGSTLPSLHPSTGPTSFDWAFLPQLLLASRLAWANPYTRRFLPLVLRIAPIIWWITILILLVMSFFSVIGMELFAVCLQVLHTHRLRQTDPCTADPDLQPNSDLYAGHSYFAHFHLALLTNVQLLVTNDWHRVMYATQTAACPGGGTRAVTTQVYFIGVYVVYQIVLYPVLIALATNAYMHFSALSLSGTHARPTSRSASSVRVEFLKREPPRDSRAAGRLSAQLKAGARLRASRVSRAAGGDARPSWDGPAGGGWGGGRKSGGGWVAGGASCGGSRGALPDGNADAAAAARRSFTRGGGSSVGEGGAGSNNSLSSSSQVPALERRSCVGARVVPAPPPIPQPHSPRASCSLGWLGRWSASPEGRRTRGSACSAKSRKSDEKIPGGGPAGAEPPSPGVGFDGASAASLDASGRVGGSLRSMGAVGRSTSSIVEGDKTLLSDAGGRGTQGGEALSLDAGGLCGGGWGGQAGAAQQAPNGEVVRGEASATHGGRGEQIQWARGDAWDEPAACAHGPVSPPGVGDQVAPRRASFSFDPTSPPRGTRGDGFAAFPRRCQSPSPRRSVSGSPARVSRASRVSNTSRVSAPCRGSGGGGDVAGSGGAGEASGGNKNSCFYVHMLKTNHYRAGGWRRDLMRSEMGEIDQAELNDLSAAAQAAHAQMVQQWAQRRHHSDSRRLPSFSPSSSGMRSDQHSRWGRAAKWVSGGGGVLAPPPVPPPTSRTPSIARPPEIGLSPEIGQPLGRVSDASSISGPGSWGGSPTRGSVGRSGSPPSRGGGGRASAAQRDEIQKLLRASHGGSAVVRSLPTVSTLPPAATEGCAPGPEADTAGEGNRPPKLLASDAEAQAVHTGHCEDRREARCEGPRGASVARRDRLGTSDGAGGAACSVGGSGALGVRTPPNGSTSGWRSVACGGVGGACGEGGGGGGGPRCSPLPSSKPTPAPLSRDAQLPPLSRSSHAHGSGKCANSSRSGSNSGFCSGSNSGIHSGPNSGYLRFPGLEEVARRSASEPNHHSGRAPAVWPSTGGGGDGDSERQAASTRSASSSAAGAAAGGGGGLEGKGGVVDVRGARTPPRPRWSGTGSSVGSSVGVMGKLASALLRPVLGSVGGSGVGASAQHVDAHGENRSGLIAEEGTAEWQRGGRGHGPGSGGEPSSVGGSGRSVAGGGGPGARLGGDGVGGETDSRAAELWDRLRRMSREEREAIFEAENALGGAAWDDLVATFEQAEMVGRFMQARKPGRESVVLFNDLTDQTQATAGVHDGQMLVVPHFVYEGEEGDESDEEGEEGEGEEGGGGWGGSAGVLAVRPPPYPASPAHRRAPTLPPTSPAPEHSLLPKGSAGGVTATGGVDSPTMPKRGLLRSSQFGLRRARPSPSRSPKVAPTCEPSSDAVK